MEEQFPMIQWIDEKGNLVQEMDQELITEDVIRNMYRNMVRIRTFDRKAISLQRQGRIGTYAPFEGQEAAQVGSAMSLRKTDWLFPTYRDHGATMTFGHSLKTILTYWNGRNEGCVPPEGLHIFPPSVPIATHLPHAAGAAYAEKRKGTDNIAVAYFGDGATSEGDFHEGLNVASVLKSPVVFFNQNNNYAISVPIHKQMNSKTIAQKSVSYDIPGVRVDGNDIIAVYTEMNRAIDRARNGEGPTLIEAVTWRYGAHTTADDPTKYREQQESEDRRASKDPVARLELYMKQAGIWDEEWVTGIKEEVAQEIDLAIEDMENIPPADVNVIFDYVFESPTWTIEKQKKDYVAHMERGDQ
ncbi:pyruvate dehydrogenase (acetyl-transferring) E1 component subunit alpha [Pontibacillus salipaludis]|uniref:pyruvate dehydrogenase (acetyl-transferring) E1 component subunit alpha n=1 Tax=Pontibacillus salipaludis TaxID=1697394 RepID=UPI0031E6087C